jgi:tRNA nucleotidyltransferase (CCA-adding enzyme)
MKLKLPITVLQTIQIFQNAKAEIYVVGGAVRDLLSGKAVKDWDFTTNLSPEKIVELFPENSFYDNVFGTVGVKILKGDVLSEAKDPIKEEKIDEKNSGQTRRSVPTNDNNENKKAEYEIYEVTTYRTESNYTDRRRPGKVEWGKSLEEDLKRRDFTINSMAVKIITNYELLITNKEQQEVEIELIDLYQGQEDLNNKLIRAVGVPDERFQEDALRMMRAIRISTELGFQIESKTFEAIQKNCNLIKEIAQERITDEFRKILSSKFPVEGIKFLQTTGILEILIPELLEGYGMKQKGHHIYDVYEHSLKALEFCENPNWAVRFAALIHDIGKPVVASGEGEARTFYNHEIVGTNIAWNLAKRMKLKREETKKLTTLVRWHMFSVSEFLTDAAIRRFIRRVGTDNIQDMMDVRIGDRLGSGCTTAEGWRLRDFKKRIVEVQKHIPSVTDLKVNGKDVMEVLKIAPGPIIGKILNELFEEIMDDPTKNEREYLVDRIKNYELGISNK